MEDDILLYDKKVFHDDEEHEYSIQCFDGVAYCHRIDDDENNIGKPEFLLLGYPRLSEIEGTAKADQVREYCGLPYNEPLTYRDLALALGRIGRYGLTVAELAALDKVAKKSGMDCWFCTTTEGNFRDLENKGRAMSGKKAVKQLIEGLQSETFAELTDEEKFALLNAASKVM